MVRRLLTTLTVAAVGLTVAPSADAHQFPNLCGGSNLLLDLAKDRTMIRDGETISYTASSGNPGGGACAVTNVTINLQLPALGGQPSATLQRLTNPLALAAGDPRFNLNPVPFVARVDPSTAPELQARISVERAVLHDSPIDHEININKTVGTTVVRPSITIDKVGSITGPLPAPQAVTYTFYVRNGTTPATVGEANTAIENVIVTDDLCPNVQPNLNAAGRNVGDADSDNKLDVTETWEFTCTTTHAAPGTYVDTATARGDHILERVPLRVVSPPDTWTVVLNAPPVPQGAVRPVRAAQARCDVRGPSGVRVRAGELTTVRVRVRNVDRGTMVRITLPGGQVVRDRANANGLAVFRLRPSRSGTARIRAADCSDVARFAVLQPRQVVAQRVPRVTG
jgi:hypothetical protein